MLEGLLLILGSFILYLVYNRIYIYDGIYNNYNIKRGGLAVSIIIFYVVIYWWYIYNNTGSYEIIENIYSILVGIDSISLYFILLVGLIAPLCILGNYKNIKKNIFLYNAIILILSIWFYSINFICIDILSFYILFESTLIPLFILIGIYGAENKEKAAYYVLLYTLVSSLFMLVSICITTYILNTTSYLIYTQYVLSLDIQIFLWFGIMLAILVKSSIISITYLITCCTFWITIRW